METTLTSKGQMTVPKPVRESLDLRVGDKIIFEETESGDFLLKPKSVDVTKLKSIVDYQGEVKSLAEMSAAVYESARSGQ